MTPKFLLLVVLSLLISFTGIAQKSKTKTQSSTKSSTTSSSNTKRKTKGKKGSTEDEFSSKRKGKHREKKQDTQSMLSSYGNGKKTQASYISRPLYYGGRTYTGSIENVSGFRICVYTGNNRAEAMRIKALFNAKFKTIRSYMSYNMPNYKIKVGDYEDKKVATKILKEIQGAFPAAFISPDVVRIVRRSLYVKPPPINLADQNLTSTSTNNNSSSTVLESKPKKKKKKKPVPVAVSEETKVG